MVYAGEINTSSSSSPAALRSLQYGGARWQDRFCAPDRQSAATARWFVVRPTPKDAADTSSLVGVRARLSYTVIDRERARFASSAGL